MYSSSWAEIPTLLPPNAPLRGSVAVSKWSHVKIIPQERVSERFVEQNHPYLHLYSAVFCRRHGVGYSRNFA